VIFKAHARRHAPAAGLTPDEIEEGIITDLGANPPEPGVPFHRVIGVRGKPVKYTGMQRTDTGAVEVGTYYWWTRRGRAQAGGPPVSPDDAPTTE
jgi:hypothetical protein